MGAAMLTDVLKGRLCAVSGHTGKGRTKSAKGELGHTTAHAHTHTHTHIFIHEWSEKSEQEESVCLRAVVEK